MMEISVLSGGAMEPGLDVVAAAFRKETGHSVSITYNSGASGRDRMNEGVFDVVVGSSHTIRANYIPFGYVEEGGLAIGRVGLGAMIRAGAPAPDISSAAAFKRALLEADAVLYTIETSGRLVEESIKKLGIHDELESRTTRFHNGPTLMDRVLAGKGREIAFLPMTAIRTYRDKGIVLLAPLPEAVQHYLEFIAVPAAKTRHREIAWKFVRFCNGPGKQMMDAHWTGS